MFSKLTFSNLQLIFILSLLLILEKLSSPKPIIAGIFNYSHLIDICELIPPNLVINALIL